MKVWLLLGLLALAFAADADAETPEEENVVEYSITVDQEAIDAAHESNKEFTAQHIEFCERFKENSNVKLVPYINDGKMACLGLVDKGPDLKLCAVPASIEKKTEQGQCEVCKILVGYHGDHIPTCAAPAGKDTGLEHFCDTKEGGIGVPTADNKCVYVEELCDPYIEASKHLKLEKVVEKLVLVTLETPEKKVGSTSSSDNVDPDDLKSTCGPYRANWHGLYDPTGYTTCNNKIRPKINSGATFGGFAKVSCWADREAGIVFDTTHVNGICDCKFGMQLGTDGRCHEFLCVSTTSGPSCRVCVNHLTNNNECAECNDGYILVRGDCLANTCTENPDSPQWQGCQACRSLENRRHTNDCSACAHGYHFLHEQRNVPNQTYTEHSYSDSTLVIKGEETGYCFPYNCIAGGNLHSMNSTIAPLVGIMLLGDQRKVNITQVINTDHLSDDMNPSVPVLSDKTYSFRDHCRTCVPQQKREKDDHCETCNPGYYLDEMHHTCRKKTCGVPHFRRNAISCTIGSLEPLPWSTACTNCLDNSDECCEMVPKVMTCGAQQVFCHLGTHNVGYSTIDCSTDGCAHLSTLCCEPKTCDNQQIFCLPGQIRSDGGDTCTTCIHAGSDCCTAGDNSCGLHDVKCGHGQHYKPSSTFCTDCTNDSLDCCTPVAKTCRNQNVFCHLGTYKPEPEEGALSCTTCGHYGTDCCETPTCENQRVPCSPGRNRITDNECLSPGDCVMDSDNCCEPLAAVEETCGNQQVKCEPRMYRPHTTLCDVPDIEDNNCDDYGLTCCEQKTCANQGVGCSVLQAPLEGDTFCTSCADNGNECCSDAKTCGLMGVKCKPGFYLPSNSPCTTCGHHGTQCCADVDKTCMNQGTICLPATYKSMGADCEDCSHYGIECCDVPNCGNQLIACGPGRERLGDDIACEDECYHNSPKCCAPLANTCANQSVKCMEGHYKANQKSIECENDCTNYGSPCCQIFQKTCGNQNVVCSSDQTYVSGSPTCTDCENHSAPCCEDVTKTCSNQNVVCRPGYYADGYDGMDCDFHFITIYNFRKEGKGCLNDSAPCCLKFETTCANQNVVCSADQIYLSPTTVCGAECINHGSKCCLDVAKTCSNQGVACMEGNYAVDYKGLQCEEAGCRANAVPCCRGRAFQTTCGSMNVKCNKNQKPKNPSETCDGVQCSNESEKCCMDVAQTCANQKVVCRPGHYETSPELITCGDSGCKNDAAPCCVAYEKTCGNQNVPCLATQAPLDPSNVCDSCTAGNARCCDDIAATCKTENIMCRPGLHKANQDAIACDGECVHHGSKCCEDHVKTCGNQNVQCKCGQSYAAPTETCDDCANNAQPCCINDIQSCMNQKVMCAPGHYSSMYMSTDCPTEGCMHDAEPCCTPYPKTCGNQNVKCGKDQVPNNPSTPCDGEFDNNSAICCTDVAATCDNQRVVCRAGHYRTDYIGRKCVVEESEGNPMNLCQNDQEHCCIAFQKTCQNQNVRCGYGLMKTKEHTEEIQCEDCVDYGKDCCEPVTKNCGNSGVMCRQDLFKPKDHTCESCDATQCCKPIPATCASSKHRCKRGHYLPGDRVCGERECSDEDCCHPVQITCANQNVQCHPETYLSGLATRECTTCEHYGSDCCSSLTCASAGVKCVSRYGLQEASNFNEITCVGQPEGCMIKDDSTPCCVPKALEIRAPTCRNIYSIIEGDERDWPHLSNFKPVGVVVCDRSQGFYYRLGTDNKPLNSMCSFGQIDGENVSVCGDNDKDCCWRKTCNYEILPDGNGGDGIVQDGENVRCPDGTKLKANPTYIVCEGDCVSDCCEPEETCSSAKVACSHGYERVPLWDRKVCGDECVENSVTCCKRTTCNKVECDLSVSHHKGAALCFKCKAFGAECCEPFVVEDTCSNQRVHCGYGFYKRVDYSSDKTCTTCLDDGEDCCLSKTCGASGIDSNMVTCDGGYQNKERKDRLPCWNCLDNGAECCQPVVPENTCLNQDVECTFGYFHKALTEECKECITNGEECCTQRTCENPDGSETAVTCGENQIAKLGSTPCTLCMGNSAECCTEQSTCWSEQVVCPIGAYHKHPNTVCGNNCDEEHCCAKKKCGNQGVCCNASLGFSKKDDFDNLECEGCTDNCETCCSYNTATCSSAKVGCGFGYRRIPSSDATNCNTCALNDAQCCEPKTCGAVECGVDHDFLGADVPCHFCNKVECCKPKAPIPTCRSENINCGVGMMFKVEAAGDACNTCVQNDSVCCRPRTCGDFDCDTGFIGVGERACTHCEHNECCVRTPTCASAGVGCGFGYRPHAWDDQSKECETCQLNDNACCEALTCANTDFVCPSGFDKIDTDKSCAFCETSECCAAVIPEKTCSNTPVVCAHGLKKIEAHADKSCGSCEMNHPVCCAKKECTEDICNSMAGFHRKMTVTNCGVCSVEECCEADVPEKTCANQMVGCGFGMKHKKYPETLECYDCTFNDGHCCDQKMCSKDGPACGSLTVEGIKMTPLVNDAACTTCDELQCCVPPVVIKTCVNQRVVCSGEHRNNDNYLDLEHGCETCLPNDLACCERKTCGNSEATCNLDLFTEVEGMADKHCMVCASNALECCEPKLCGHHFLDSAQSPRPRAEKSTSKTGRRLTDRQTCDEETQTVNPRNQPCVNCDASECCTDIIIQTLKCAEIVIPNGQAFYTESAGPGSARTKGSVLRVECDLGFKSQGAEYFYSDNVMSRDQSADVDHPVCDPVLIEEMIEGHVEVYSPATSGWSRSPPACQPVTCPLLTVESLYTPDAPGKWGSIGKVIYRDAQMDEVPMRGAGYGPRDYAAEADVECTEGWVRVPNVCVTDAESTYGKETVTNTLEWKLKGYWKFEMNTKDNSPHCKSSRGSGTDGLGSCNDGVFNGAENYADGVPMDNDDTNKSLVYDGTDHYVEVRDVNNENWSTSDPNELDIDGGSWTASIWINLADDAFESDAYLFARYTEKYEEVVAIKLNNGFVGVIYNGNQENPKGDKKLEVRKWTHILARCYQQTVDLFIDGVLVSSYHFPDEDSILDTEFGHVFIGADKESDNPLTINQYFHGQIDEVRYYTRGLTDQEILCISQKRDVCPTGFYAKPYNTQGCNRESEEIATYEDCVDAVTQLLRDSILGNSLNGGTRYNRKIEDKQPNAAIDTPTKCSYRESDSQIMWNPNPTGRAHTSLAPICKRIPGGEDIHTVGCLPKCLENGQWSVGLPTCEKDWCNPIFKEWSCCQNRETEMAQQYFLNHHEQSLAKCPIGYGDCDNDDECTNEKGVEGLCGQIRDLDKVDLCIVDMDPCDNVVGATGTMCRVWTAVGGDFESTTNTHIASSMFMAGMVLALGTMTGLYLCRGRKGEEHYNLLEEEL